MTYAVWIPLLPLLGWVVNGLWGQRWGRRPVAFVACGTVVAAFAVGLALLRALSALPPDAQHVEVDLYRWFAAGPVVVPMRLLVDPLSVVMVLVVTGVGALIHIYSAGYMADDDGFARYFAYLNLFMASMLTLVLAGNLVVMFIGWEGVGLCSYLLIAFWFTRPAAAAAGVKAFLVTRLGDVGFLLGIFLAFGVFGTVDFGVMTRDAVTRLPLGGAAATALCLLLFLGATGKSAQLPLYIWLPDAMEGPTPVSALIHAATMVTAGVFMIVRMHAVYLQAPLAMDVVAIVGAVTAIFAAASALVEPDLKRVLAYSTISQLGYMFLAVGVGAWGAGIFHLTSHAFFKALLFLAAGSVMHALGGTTDMRQMGGLAKPLPRTAATFGIGALALAGIPPLTGFFSKDQILSAAFRHGDVVLWAVGLAAAGLTAVYIVRAFVLTFLGAPAPSAAGGPHGAHAPHEAPPVMGVPIQALAVLTVLGGALGLSFTHPGVLERFLAPVVGAPAPAPAEAGGGGSEVLLVAASIAVALAGGALAWAIYRTRTLRGESAAVRAVLAHQFYVEDLYNAVVAAPTRGLARAFDLFDRDGVDGIVMAIARGVGAGGAWLRGVQTGYLRHYAALVLIGVIIFLAYWVSR
ncbi:MAG TPA: NADH-quinone oxidoreductase subunit L [bacterium]|nr:NADH-quinone oxidoreductase subunit L [bacterium]